MKLIFFISVFLNCIFSFGQTSERINKTFKDTLFNLEYRILAPKIHLPLSGGADFHDSIKIIADFLKKHPEINVEIGVHTDRRGSYDSNLLLSVRKAIAIRNELIHNFNINPNKIETKGYGESEPIVEWTVIRQASTRREKELVHQQNRRTEITIIK